MPIAVLCGNCNAKLNAPDAAAGKKVKCPKCATVLQIPAPEPEPDFEVVDEPAPTPKAKPKAPAIPKPVLLDESEGMDEEDAPRPPAKKKKPVVLAEDDDEDEAPTPKKKKGKKQPAAKSSSLPLLIGGGILGLALVGFLVYWFVLREPDVAKAPDTKPPGDPGTPIKPGDPGKQPGSSERPATPPAGWKLVEHPEFSAWFGDKGRIGNEYMDKSPLPQGFPYPLGTRIVTLEPGKTADARPLAVFVVPLSADQKAKATTNLGDVIKELFAREFLGPNAAGVALKDATLDGKPGVEFSDTRRGNTLHFLGAIANERAYLLIAGGQNVTADDDAVKTFRGSFRFGTNVPPVPTAPPPKKSNPDAPTELGPLVATDLSEYGYPVVIDLPKNAVIRKERDVGPKSVSISVDIKTQEGRPPNRTLIQVSELRPMVGDTEQWLNTTSPGWKAKERSDGQFFWEAPTPSKGKLLYGGLKELKVGNEKAWVHFQAFDVPDALAQQFWTCVKSAKAK